MKFKDMPYKRVDFAEVEKEMNALIAEFESAKSGEEQFEVHKKYYALTGEVEDVDERMGNEMADVIAQVIRLADYYNIDLEKAFIDARKDEENYLTSRGV